MLKVFFSIKDRPKQYWIRPFADSDGPGSSDGLGGPDGNAGPESPDSYMINAESAQFARSFCVNIWLQTLQ